MEEVDFLGSSFAKPFYGRYLKESSGVVKKIFVDKEITSLFLDIQAFTTVAVDLKASDLVADLDKYFDLAIGIIVRNNGTIVNLVGDAIVAVFGEDQNPDHPDDACMASVEIIQEMKKFNLDRPGRPQFHLGAGINTGIASIGVFGNSNHYQFMVVGDIVNLASRTQGLTRYYKKEILTTNFTVSRLRKNMKVKMLEKVAVKGIDESVGIYEIET